MAQDAAAAAAKSLQSCPTLWDPIDGSLPGFPVPGILQARTLSVLPFPPPRKTNKAPMWVCVLSHSVVSDSVTLLTVALQAPLPMGFFQARMLERVVAFSKHTCY